MALSNTATLSAKTLYSNTHAFSHQQQQPSFTLVPTANTKPVRTRISAVHAAEPSTKQSSPSVPAAGSKWSVESWKTKKALQLPEYPDKKDLETVLKTLEDFPPIVFAGEARHLEDKLAAAPPPPPQSRAGTRNSRARTTVATATSRTRNSGR
ncbi:hypothetical protein CMV_005678 [Castanea mollissima]|uniref:Phospho-2-dehydro-3-deoxyheptonate aldolase n=1 Tax=Castanea mollissima TaxID=60419 RepID=A0A8J4RD96_9ROSI|nr:hypothetical protein CMV_005678 [Castanea mollissima]